jgi:hypothetical protein
MILIAHRGNVFGPNKTLENHPDYILAAIKSGYDVEIDVRVVDQKLYLGHDEPQYEISSLFLREHSDRLWCHAKNLEALEWLLTHDIHAFWHQEDDYTLTSKNFIWVYPNKRLAVRSICVLPELGFSGDLSKCYGICSDFVEDIKAKGSYR